MLSNQCILFVASSLLLAFALNTPPPPPPFVSTVTSSAERHEVGAHSRDSGYNNYLQSDTSSFTGIPTVVEQISSCPTAVRSISPSQSISPSISQSSSPSISQSFSPSMSISPSISQSFSPSISLSISPSISQSISPTRSQSILSDVGIESSSPSLNANDSQMHNDRCETPIVTPSKGTYAGSVLVSFSTATKGARICFNINSHLVPSATEGDCVSNGDSVELSQTGALNIQAVASLDGLEDSAVLKTTFTILAKAKAPSITPEDTTVFTTSATLTITTATVGSSTIYYTDNEEEDVPTTSSLTIENGGQLIIDRPGDHTIRCIVVAEGMEASDVVTRHISILERTKQPAMDPQSGHFIGNVNVKFHCSDEDGGSSTIYYTTDGKSTPSQQSSRHVHCGEDISLTAPGSYVVRAFSVADGKSQSELIHGTFALTRSPLDKYKVSRRMEEGGRFQVQPEVELIVVEKDLEYSYQCPKRSVRGRLVILHNPSGHFDVLPPLTGCSSGKLEFPSVSGRTYQSSAFNLTDYVVRDATDSSSSSSIVIDTSKIERLPWYMNSLLTDGSSPGTASGRSTDHLKSIDLSVLRELQAQYNSVQSLGCQVVTNAGFFNVTSGTCTGNLISGGVIHQLTDKHNVNFGMRDGEFYIGYLRREEITDPSLPAFDFLISGLGWLVRGGRSYIDESLSSLEDAENMSAQSNGAAVFKTLKSARTAIGHDAEGNLMLLQVEGESFVRGMDLNEFADFAVELGFVSAINLDGGGSATMTQNHSLISEPSWTCIDPPYKNHRYYHCEKRVSSITCIHAMAPPFVEQSVLPVNLSTTSSSMHGQATISLAELGALQNQLYLFQLSTGILSTVLVFLFIVQFACCISSVCRAGKKGPVLPLPIERTTASGSSQYIEMTDIIDIEKNTAVGIRSLDQSSKEEVYQPSSSSMVDNNKRSGSKKAMGRDADAVLDWKPPADNDDDFYNDDDDDHTGLLVHQKKKSKDPSPLSLL